jgi:hypothetical protein
MRIGARALIASAAVFAACDAHDNSRAPDSGTATAVATRTTYFEPGAVLLGSRGPGRSGTFGASVGKDFGAAEADEVLKRLVALDSSGEFAQFTCGEPAPRFRFDLTLHAPRARQDRQVTVGYTPELYLWGKQRCLAFGLSYLVSRTFAEVDTSPSVELPFVAPRTADRTAVRSPGDRHLRRWPTCNCAMSRDSAWVKSGPRETSYGQNAH